MDWIEDEVTGVESGSVESGSVGTRFMEVGYVDKVLICQNLTELSSDVEMREEEEENMTQEISLVWPWRVWTR